MSVTRPFIWKCNLCPNEQYKQGYGLPNGWGYHASIRIHETVHICDVCIEKHNLKMDDKRFVIINDNDIIIKLGGIDHHEKA